MRVRDYLDINGMIIGIGSYGRGYYTMWGSGVGSGVIGGVGGEECF